MIYQFLAELKDTNRIGCLNALIRFLDVNFDILWILLNFFYLHILHKLLSDSSNDQKYKINEYNLNNYLKLDSGAFTSLNLLPNRSDPMSFKRTHSLYGVLNRCSTQQGQRLLTQWIKQPLIDIHKIGRLTFHLFDYDWFLI